MKISPLTAISPIDGRYAHKVEILRPFFSESALMRFRLWVEIRWLQALANSGISELTPFSEQAKSELDHLFYHFSEQDAEQIKNIEHTTNHDVKAIEYFIQEKIANKPEFKNASSFIHFACTSEDINNLAYGLILQSVRRECLLPFIDEIGEKLQNFAHREASQAMLARTHGQPATPTTLGKEFANVLARLKRQRQGFNQVEILGKFNGAVGNFNAHFAAYPEINWENLAKNFVEQLGLIWNPYTTQIEPHDYIAEFCQALMRINTILIDFNADAWNYIALGYFKLKSVAQEIGSSTMPHKINPIDFENSEGNLSLANSLLNHFAIHLPRSRWQRDLRDSTVLRNLGVACAHSIIGYQALLTGLDKIAPDKPAMETDLDQHWEVLAEAIQTILRRYNYSQPYEKLKELTRGKKINSTLLQDFIAKLDVTDKVKQQLLALSPKDYLGNAAAKAKEI